MSFENLTLRPMGLIIRLDLTSVSVLCMYHLVYTVLDSDSLLP